MLATGLGSGRLRPGPGTWGSLSGLLLWWLLTLLWATPLTTWFLGHKGDPRGLWVFAAGEAWFAVLVVGMTALAVRSADLVVRETGEQDPGYIVVDEWAGMWIALWLFRWELAENSIRILAPGGWRWAYLLALPFLLFRLLDIWKPWPIRQIQALPGGEGIVADDVVAGLLTLPLVMLLRPFLLTWLQRF
jgi:phosphatidylglycerophosphatase A